MFDWIPEQKTSLVVIIVILFMTQCQLSVTGCANNSQQNRIIERLERIEAAQEKSE